ncbi:hypothetical protein JO972_11925 [Verrucomicrobiaceae bacterium 5K15]|uniref:Porin n=1 Tax=Oceaniferula flava TaxID=2800421 RepID=A0AAE2VD33_9BACT|nr:hypothetical protein [Oceaniferula flavus]MBK1855671.1 hypothetical protein [Oceaniferula flavus]MBM1136977.1 hypothetical protein [Oceaniferula flavus]
MTKNNMMITAALAACVSAVTAEEAVDTPVSVVVPAIPEIRIDPTLHLRAVHGSTTLDSGEAERGGHDPFQDGFNLQGMEIGASIYAGEYVRGFFTTNVYKVNGGDFESEFEEGFIKFVNLPGDFEVRAGRMLARFGDQNARHLHGWDFVDGNMAGVRYLGEDGFAFEGAEITWMPPTSWTDSLSIGLGSAVVHDHEHGEEEEEDHDEDDHDDDDHADEDLDDHEHDEEAEMARPIDNIVTVRYQAQFGPTDFHRFQVGASYLTGDNGHGLTTDIYGADFTYTWRENGYEPGGKQFRWRTEWIMRDVETDEGGFEDNGYNTAVMYEFIEGWEAGLRYEWMEGVADPELAERTRISPSLTKHFRLDNDISALVRLQYNHDDIDGHGTEDSVWLQFGFDWGPGEVR